MKLTQLVKKMKNEGNSIEDIAKAVNNQRNQNRLNDYIDDPIGLERVMARNEAKYGNPLGPTAEFSYNKYGSWEKVAVYMINIIIYMKVGVNNNLL